MDNPIESIQETQQVGLAAALAGNQVSNDEIMSPMVSDHQSEEMTHIPISLIAQQMSQNELQTYDRDYKNNSAVYDFKTRETTESEATHKTSNLSSSSKSTKSNRVNSIPTLKSVWNVILRSLVVFCCCYFIHKHGFIFEFTPTVSENRENAGVTVGQRYWPCLPNTP